MCESSCPVEVKSNKPSPRNRTADSAYGATGERSLELDLANRGSFGADVWEVPLKGIESTLEGEPGDRCHRNRQRTDMKQPLPAEGIGQVQVQSSLLLGETDQRRQQV